MASEIEPQPVPLPIVERHGVAQMIGEALREMAILFAVFIPIDLAIESRQPTLGWIVSVITLGAGLFFAGVLIERKRTR
jgi:hypothetical protein